MEKSVFLQEQGDTPKNRVWNFLIVHSEYDYSMTEIAKQTQIGYTTLKNIWKEFKTRNIVIQTRAIGKAKMYKLNSDNPVVEKFIDFYWTVVESVIQKDVGKVKENFTSPTISLPVSTKGF